MKALCLTVSVLVTLAACSNKTSEVGVAADSSATIASAASMTADSASAYADEVPEYATFFIVIADTGNDYHTLHNKMFTLKEPLKLPVDTMGRYFNTTKNLIALPDNDEDEMYAGSYFPRRFPSENLSLEYLSIYQKNVEEKTIALVSGIYQYEKDADSALAILKRAESKGFKIKAEVYVGCMH